MTRQPHSNLPRCPDRRTILLRAAAGRCPRCASSKIFRTRYRLQEYCPECGLSIEHEDGWSLGAIPLNYAITCLFWILPLGLLFLFDLIPLRPVLIIAGTGSLVFPILTYRFSKCLWIGIYYAILPHELLFTGR